MDQEYVPQRNAGSDVDVDFCEHLRFWDFGRKSGEKRFFERCVCVCVCVCDIAI